jgi:chitinase
VAAGVPRAKLVLGVPFYGRAWGDVAGDGLYQPGGPVKEKIDTRYGSPASRGEGGWVRRWDPRAQAPFLWHPEKRIFITYDDPESLRIKSHYILEQGLGGVMFWQYFSDKTGELLGTLFEELRGGEPSGARTAGR